MPRDLLVLDAIREVRAAGVRIRCLPMKPREVRGLGATVTRARAVGMLRRSIRRGWRVS